MRNSPDVGQSPEKTIILPCPVPGFLLVVKNVQNTNIFAKILVRAFWCARLSRKPRTEFRVFYFFFVKNASLVKVVPRSQSFTNERPKDSFETSFFFYLQSWLFCSWMASHAKESSLPKVFPAFSSCGDCLAFGIPWVFRAERLRMRQACVCRYIAFDASNVAIE